MVINIRLADVHQIEPGIESMGRSWFGYDPACSDDELWSQNRGRYAFSPTSVEAQQYATLSYRGKVMVVAVLREPKWEPFEDYERGVMKRALIGDVLGPGDEVYDMLRGTQVPRGRSAWIYLDDDAYVGEVGTGEPLRTRTSGNSSRQGWEPDSPRRKAIEDAAQDRLMDLYREAGWDVEDTRFRRPFDAVARRGHEVVYLEAKGTQSAGSAVLVTRGEIEHARRHPTQCVMGVLSGIRLDSLGRVDPDSGTFRVLPFEPDQDALVVTGYEWRLPAE